MLGLPVGTRKRDRLKQLVFSRSASLKNSQAPNAEASNTSPVRAPVLPPPSANPVAPVVPSAPSALSSTVASTATAAPSQAAPSSPSTPPARDLWFDALQTLSEDEQQTIQNIQPTQATQRSLSGRIEELVSITRMKQDECEKKSYKFRFQGKEIILRDVAEKIVLWLDKFKAVGDIVANFDPVHASLPWAGARFLLQAAVGEHEQMGALLVSVEKVTYLTNRCTIYEVLYGPETTPGQVLHNLHAALVVLYAAILRLIALAHRLFAKNTATRVIHALINSGEVSDFLAEFQGLETQVEIEAQNCERMRSQEVDANLQISICSLQKVLESFQKPILRTDERVSSFLEKVDQRERLEILEWISNVQHGMNHETVKEKRTKSTCEWLLRHERYLEWQDTSSSTILWLHGTPGTGKTYLTSRAIDEIQDTLKSNPNHEGLAFFYCNRNETERQEPLSVLRSFVRQLSTIANDEDSIQKNLRQLHIQTRLKASELNMDVCKNLLLEFINLYPKTTLVLDALDECDKRKRGVLIETFDYFLDHASRPVKIFISSRPDGDIKERFKNRANIEIQATDNHDDIATFVESEITKHRRWKKISLGLQEEIVETLQKRSQGMFQWASLQIDQLLDLILETDIRDRLGKLPKDLKDAYDEIYNRIKARSESERQIADRAFQWVMCSCTPLSTKELLPAVCQNVKDDAIKPVEDIDEELVLELCHNLLVIDPNRQVWTPSHLSVIEYFEDHHWSQKQANCLVASVCLLLLNDTAFYNRESDSLDGSVGDAAHYNRESDSLDDSVNDSLSVYARHHWMIHVQRCGEEGVSGRLLALLKRFLGSPMDSSAAYQSWHRMITRDGYERPLSSFFSGGRFGLGDLAPASSASFAICAFGFYTILSGWWDSPWTERVYINKRGHSLLQLAAIAGSVSICGRLVDWGAEVNEQLQAGNYGSALAAAARWGNKELVRLLIESGADVNARLQVGDYGSALAAAAINRGGMKIVRLLIESGADVDAQLQVGDYGSALVAAAYSGNKELVRLLIEPGADVNAQLQVGDYGSALTAAAYRGNKEVVRLLIESGADVNAQLQVGSYGSVLAAAAWGGNKEVVRLLIESGADVNARLQVGYYGSVLAAAAWAAADGVLGDREVVRLLIESGAEVNAPLQVGNYGSALAAGAGKFRGDKEVVRLLIKSGADVNAQLQVGKYGSALAAAARYRDNKEVVRLLIESGADVNVQIQFGDYGSALAAAAYWGHKKVMQLLIESGADVNTQLQFGDYGSALAAAATAYGDNKEVIQLLIESGADVNAQLQVGIYGSALAAAAYGGNKEVIRLLIESGADVNAQLQVGNYGSALAAAAVAGDKDNKEVVLLLIESGADVNVQLQFGDYGSALAAAAYWGHKKVLQLLIESGADVNAQLQVGNYDSALAAAAAAGGDEEVVQLLVEFGAEVNTQL